MTNELATTTKYDIQLQANEAVKAFDLLPVNETTRADYKARIGLYVDFINQHGLNRNTLLDYRRYLDSRTDYSVSTKNKYFTSAKRYTGVLHTAGLLPVDITKDISGKDLKGFKQNKKHKKDGLQPDEVQRLSQYLTSLEPTPNNYRLKAMLALFMYQGLRQIEVTRLDVTDIDLKNGKAFIHGKGRDDKEPIALHPYTTQALADYLKVSGKKSGALFTSTSNNSYNQRITTRGLRKVITGVLDSLGIDNSVHGFRHYFTTTMVKHYKGDLLTVAHYTRHKNLEMLQVYNDAINAEADLPRYYKAFEGLTI
jgi:integrase/recombinase XerC